MRQHNIVLVVLDRVKANKKLLSRHNVIDFETYFKIEVPNILEYWNDRN